MRPVRRSSRSAQVRASALGSPSSRYWPASPRQPLRRRVEYCRACTIGAVLRPTADLPPCCADTPDFPPRRSRRLGAGEAASSGWCWSRDSDCCVMRSPQVDVVSESARRTGSVAPWTDESEGLTSRSSAPPLEQRSAHSALDGVLGRRRGRESQQIMGTTLPRIILAAHPRFAARASRRDRTIM